MTFRAPARICAALGAVALFSVSASASVCETVRPGWVPEEGAPDQWHVTIETFSSWLGVAVLAIVILSIALRRRKLYKLSALSMLAFAIFVVWQPMGDRELAAAIEEGCRATPELPVAILIALGILLGALSRWTARGR